MKSYFIFLFLALSLYFSFNKNPIEASKRNKYQSRIRPQEFLHVKTGQPNFTENGSEVLDELDQYELKETSSLTNEESIRDDKQKEKLVFKNIENERNDNELITEEKNTGLTGGKTCVVSEKGILDMSINSNDFFNLNKYMVELTTVNIVITDVESPQKIIKTIPYESIKLPIETIESTIECWKIKANKEKIIFCGKKQEDRDTWVTNILKALFCYNTNTLTVEQNEKKRKNQNITLPTESTADQRLSAMR